LTVEKFEEKETLSKAQKSKREENTDSKRSKKSNKSITSSGTEIEDIGTPTIFQKKFAIKDNRRRSMVPQTLNSFQMFRKQIIEEEINVIENINLINNNPENKNNMQFKVAARFRPFNSMESEINSREKHNLNNYASSAESADNLCVEFIDTKSVRIKNQNQIIQLDRIFGQSANQDDIYTEIAQDTIKDILVGYNGTIFTYGQSGSGKTHTMYGQDIWDDELKGIIPRSIEHLFRYIESQKNKHIKFELKCSILEVYKENLYDLLNPETDHRIIKIKEHPKRGIYVDNLHEEYISECDDFFLCLEQAEKFRVVTHTLLNKASSRSHCLFILEVLQKFPDGVEKKGILNLVDLAGSEKISKTGAVGETLEEAKKINLSLATLGNVICALTSPNVDFIPYRDSKLTRILQDSLGGNFKTTLIVACSPHSYNAEETYSTLKFAQRAKKIKNKVTMNIKKSPEELEKMIFNLTKELQGCRREIAALKSSSGMSPIAQKNSIFNTKKNYNNNFIDIANLNKLNNQDSKIPFSNNKSKNSTTIIQESGNSMEFTIPEFKSNYQENEASQFKPSKSQIKPYRVLNNNSNKTTIQSNRTNTNSRNCNCQCNCKSGSQNNSLLENDQEEKKNLEETIENLKNEIEQFKSQIEQLQKQINTENFLKEAESSAKVNLESLKSFIINNENQVNQNICAENEKLREKLERFNRNSIEEINKLNVKLPRNENKNIFDKDSRGINYNNKNTKTSDLGDEFKNFAQNFSQKNSNNSFFKNYKFIFENYQNFTKNIIEDLLVTQDMFITKETNHQNYMSKSRNTQKLINTNQTNISDDKEFNLEKYNKLKNQFFQMCLLNSFYEKTIADILNKLRFDINKFSYQEDLLKEYENKIAAFNNLFSNYIDALEEIKTLYSQNLINIPTDYIIKKPINSGNIVKNVRRKSTSKLMTLSKLINVSNLLPSIGNENLQPKRYNPSFRFKETEALNISEAISESDISSEYSGKEKIHLSKEDEKNTIFIRKRNSKRFTHIHKRRSKGRIIGTSKSKVSNISNSVSLNINISNNNQQVKSEPLIVLKNFISEMNLYKKFCYSLRDEIALMKEKQSKYEQNFNDYQNLQIKNSLKEFENVNLSLKVLKVNIEF
jgi:hypothetical protein